MASSHPRDTSASLRFLVVCPVAAFLEGARQRLRCRGTCRPTPGEPAAVRPEASPLPCAPPRGREAARQGSLRSRQGPGGVSAARLSGCPGRVNEAALQASKTLGVLRTIRLSEVLLAISISLFTFFF